MQRWKSRLKLVVAIARYGAKEKYNLKSKSIPLNLTISEIEILSISDKQDIVSKTAV